MMITIHICFVLLLCFSHSLTKLKKCVKYGYTTKYALHNFTNIIIEKVMKQRKRYNKLKVFIDSSLSYIDLREVL